VNQLDALWAVLACAVVLLMLPVLLLAAFVPKPKRLALLQKLGRKLNM